jgi:hypothetical protein
MSRFGRVPRKGREPEYQIFKWECNRIRGAAGEEPMFGRPSIEDWWAGGESHEYDDVRVIFGTDDLEVVRIVPKTDAGRETMVAAAEALGIHIAEMRG